ncbi:thermostable hemolysin [Pseudomonas sp.]|uniref:thermostable hemolysin n=1 Tax=Pseudomonas sp. TaxID=306 RepID=UPI003265C72F
MNSFLHTSSHNEIDHARFEIIKRSEHSAPEPIGYIQEIYKRHYGAQMTPNPDLLVTRRNLIGGALTACAGISFASPTRPLFSERYFDEPIEDVLGALSRQTLLREQIVEIGSLASDDSHAAAEIIKALPIMAWFMGAKAILCTSTRRLRVLLKYHGIPLRVLGDADAGRLSDLELQQWGSYYAQSPQTGVILLEECSHLFNQYCGRLKFTGFEHRVGHAEQVAA